MSFSHLAITNDTQELALPHARTQHLIRSNFHCCRVLFTVLRAYRTITVYNLMVVQSDELDCSLSDPPCSGWLVGRKHLGTADDQTLTFGGRLISQVQVILHFLIQDSTFASCSQFLSFQHVFDLLFSAHTTPHSPLPPIRTNGIGKLSAPLHPVFVVPEMAFRNQCTCQASSGEKLPNTWEGFSANHRACVRACGGLHGQNGQV